MPRSDEAPLRVLHVIGGLELGGAETLLYRLATHPAPGVEHQVICLGNRDWYSGPLEQHGIAVHHLGMTSALSTVTRLRRLRTLLRESGADVVQSWMYFANVLSGIFARRARIPVVWGIHASTFDHLGLPSRLCALGGGRFARQLADFVINCSTRSAEIHAGYGYSAVPNAIIPNGCDPAAFFPDAQARAATRGALGIEEGTFLIGGVARWHVEKDIPNLLRATRLAADGGVPLRCLLIGPGLDVGNPELAAEIADKSCERLTIPLGSRPDVQDLDRALDLHVLASRSEAFPNVVAESMLSGTPNAVTDVGDSAFMVGDSGWVAPQGDSAGLANCIAQAWREWSEDPEAWEARRKSARRRIIDKFTFGRMAEAYVKTWRQVAAEAQRARR